MDKIFQCDSTDNLAVPGPGLERPEPILRKNREGGENASDIDDNDSNPSEVSADGSRNSDEESNNSDDIDAWDAAKILDKIQENTNNEGSCRERIESNNRAPTIGDADKVSKSSIVSSCKQTRSNALSSTSTTANNTEKDQNDLDEGTTSIGTKGSDKVVSDIKTYLR